MGELLNYTRGVIQKYPFISTGASAVAAYYAPKYKPAMTTAVAWLAKLYGVCQ